MEVYHQIEQFPKEEQSAVFSIGFFDGVHRGHQYVLDKLKEQAELTNSKQVVLTFSNHPTSVLRPDKPAALITSLNHKIRLLEERGIDFLFLLPFTKEFSKQSTTEFLDTLFYSIPLRAFVLGHDTRIGKDRKGDEDTIQAYAAKKHCSVTFVDEFMIEGKTVSSSRVREYIKKGNFFEVEKLLGRPYSILLPVHKGLGIGKKIGYSTANLDVHELCLPPLGVYSVWLKAKGNKYPAVVNLGIAPTVKHSKYPELEAHVIDQEVDLRGEEIEVFFVNFIRHEKKFHNLHELHDQITKDIAVAKSQLQ